MTEQLTIPKKPLALAMLIGICGNASLAVLTNPVVPFSFFPLIALWLAAYLLLQHYRHEAMVGNTPICTLLCFLIGVFGYSALLKVQYPQLGSNFFSLILMLLLLAVLSIKLGLSLGKKERP
ncbi:MAG: YijD family membrane protein [Aeromonas sp.]